MAYRHISHKFCGCKAKNIPDDHRPGTPLSSSSSARSASSYQTGRDSLATSPAGKRR